MTGFLTPLRGLKKTIGLSFQGLAPLAISFRPSGAG